MPSDLFITTEYTDDPAWNDVIASLSQRYGIDLTTVTLQDIKAIVPAKNKAIDFDFALSPPDAPVQPTVAFRYLHVELLLDQAADFLERAVQSRVAWDELNAKRSLQDLEIIEFAFLDNIHEAEIKAGLFKQPAIQSSASQNAEAGLAGPNKDALNTLSNLANNIYSGARIDQQVEAAGAMAYLGVYPPFAKDVKVGDEFGYKDPLTGVTVILPAAQRDYTKSLKNYALYNEQQNAETQLQMQTGACNRSEALIPAMQSKTLWDQADEDFQLERTSVARNLAKIKLMQATEIGGALNYTERMASVQKRCGLDFSQALRRCIPAQQGLDRLYGYTVPLPDSAQSLITGNALASREFIDDLLFWVREAISWRVGFSQLEQSYVIPISMKSYSEDHASGLAQAEWSFDITPATAALIFPANERYIRLLGVSAYAVGDKAKGVWQATLTAPNASFCIHDDGQNVVLDQSFVPSCRLGRVATRDSQRDPDIAGAGALHNVSPFGQWRLTFSETSTSGIKTSDLEDVQIDFHITMHSI